MRSAILAGDFVCAPAQKKENSLFPIPFTHQSLRMVYFVSSRPPIKPPAPQVIASTGIQFMQLKFV